MSDYKTTDQDFKRFKTSFMFWYKKLGLQGWQVFFRHEELDIPCYARIVSDYGVRAATIKFNKTVCEDDVPEFDPIRSGKHEAFHLLLAPLEYHAHARYIHREDIDSAEEEIVVRLQNTIPDDEFYEEFGKEIVDGSGNPRT